MPADHTRAAEKQSSVVATIIERRFRYNVSYLVRDSKCLSVRVIPSLLIKSPGTGASIANDVILSVECGAFCKDDALVVVLDLIHEHVRIGGYDVLYDDVTLTFVKSSFFKMGPRSNSTKLLLGN